jgi:hypothetical protein
MDEQARDAKARQWQAKIDAARSKQSKLEQLLAEVEAERAAMDLVHRRIKDVLEAAAEEQSRQIGRTGILDMPNATPPE